MKNIAATLGCLLALHAAPLAARSACASAGAPAPLALFERFTSADCEACWQDAATPVPGAGALVLDWIVPGLQGDDAPLAAAAASDALARLAALGRAAPGRAAPGRTAPGPAPQPPTDVHTVAVEPAPGLRLRVGQGPAVNDYLGATAALSATRPAAARTLHLLLVEQIPAGSHGTPVARNVVRNMLEVPWDGRGALSRGGRLRWTELRPMRIAEGAHPERLRTVGWVQDAQGRVVAAAQSVCR